MASSPRDLLVIDVCRLPEQPMVYRNKALAWWLIAQYQELLDKLNNGGAVPDATLEGIVSGFRKQMEVYLVFESGMQNPDEAMMWSYRGMTLMRIKQIVKANKDQLVALRDEILKRLLQ